MKELKIDADICQLNNVLSFIDNILVSNKCETEICRKINIAVEEIFVNIAYYAYTPKSGKVIIRINFGDEISIEFEDSGKPFNPLKKNKPDISKSAMERDIGGLGIFMTTKLMDSVTYKYENKKNILTIKNSRILGN